MYLTAQDVASISSSVSNLDLASGSLQIPSGLATSHKRDLLRRMLGLFLPNTASAWTAGCDGGKWRGRVRLQSGTALCRLLMLVLRLQRKEGEDKEGGKGYFVYHHRKQDGRIIKNSTMKLESEAYVGVMRKLPY